MVEANGIVGISSCYLAGIAAARAAAPGGSVLYATGTASLAAALVSMALFCRKPGGLLWGYVTFLFLGIFSSCCGELCAALQWHRPAIAQTSFELLKTAISRCGLTGSAQALVTALLTGDRSGLSPEATRAFRDAGAAHILALSGLHLGIIYALLKKTMAPAGRSRAAQTVTSLTGVAASGFYVLVTGCGASVVRAFLFICLNEASRLCPGRRRSPMSVYATALMIQLTISPEAISSVGFQLSYLAMLGIYVLFPTLDSWYPGTKKSPLKRIWSASALTISCQLFTSPLVWLYFRSFPVYFLITNLVALPLTEALIICAVATTTATAAGLCPPPLVHLTDLLSGFLLDFLEAVASIS